MRPRQALAVGARRLVGVVALGAVSLAAAGAAGGPGPQLRFPGVLPAVTLVVLVAVGIGRHRSRRALDRTAAQRRDAVVEIGSALAAELRAGRGPHEALLLAVEAVPALAAELRPVLAASEAGADVAPALRAAAETPGAEGLRRVAACWQVAAQAGAGLAVALDRVAEGLRADQAVRREVTAQLAAPRATGRLLALLPGVGLLMGAGLGADPLRFLLGTPLGMACLVAGCLLLGLGLLWTDRLGRALEDRL